MLNSRRRQIITDQSVQGELIFRAIVYWFFCLLVVELLVLGWAMFSGPSRPFPVVIRQSLSLSAPAVFGSVLLLPVVLIDVLKVSNRFVGPIQQVRHTLRQLAKGEPARRVYLRKGDFWQELAHHTNLIADQLEGATEDEHEIDEDYDFNEDIPCTDDLVEGVLA